MLEIKNGLSWLYELDHIGGMSSRWALEGDLMATLRGGMLDKHG